MLYFYAIGSVVLVSLVSLIGLFTISFSVEKLKNILFILVAFAAGSLIGDVFFHLLPEYIEMGEFTVISSSLIIVGIVTMLFIEKFIHWHHCHHVSSLEHAHPFAIMNLIGDAFHNFLDGLIVGASYLVSIPVGIATTIAVVLHEIPQEISDFGVLLQGGFKKTKALMFNFLSALTAVLGVVLALILNELMGGMDKILIPFTIGAFIYIAGTDLIPEIHKELKVHRSLAQLLAFVLGILIMLSLLLLE